MKTYLTLTSIIFLLGSSINASPTRKEYHVTGTHKVGSPGPLTNQIGCQLALKDAFRKADEKCYRMGYNTYSRRGLRNGSCGRNMWSRTKRIKLSFYCQ